MVFRNHLRSEHDKPPNEPEIIGFCKCEIEIPKVRAYLGYDLRHEYWNMGIMTETLGAVIEFTFKTLDILIWLSS